MGRSAGSVGRSVGGPPRRCWSTRIVEIGADLCEFGGVLYSAHGERWAVERCRVERGGHRVGGERQCWFTRGHAQVAGVGGPSARMARS